MYVALQPLYLNAVGEIYAPLAPEAMLEELHLIERDFGRDRSKEIRNGPRTLDLDILLCDELVRDGPDLTLPHPRIAERRFVLIPLLELDPSLINPRTGSAFSAALADLNASEGSDGPRGVYLYHAR
jgi:2-amino-4-hydroxy-6-hydroxymethyldihydropteridine diphosphokinase